MWFRRPLSCWFFFGCEQTNSPRRKGGPLNLREGISAARGTLQHQIIRVCPKILGRNVLPLLGCLLRLYVPPPACKPRPSERFVRTALLLYSPWLRHIAASERRGGRRRRRPTTERSSRGVALPPLRSTPPWLHGRARTQTPLFSCPPFRSNPTEEPWEEGG